MFRHILLPLLLTAGLVSCAPQKTETPRLFDPLVDVWPHDLSDIPQDPDVTYGQLENGMRYAIQTNARPEKEAVVRFRIAAGSKHETEATLGLAHYLEHMAFNGSENVPEGEMVKSLERLGLSFGADTNASTTYSRTQYMLNLPDIGDETVDYALFLMRETADKLLIEPGAVDRERGVVKAEEARSNTPGREASRAQQAFLYPDWHSTHRPVIGLPETLDTLTAEQLRAFYDKYYRPERSLLVVTGDFDRALMKNKIEDVFSDWVNEVPNPAEPDEGQFIKRPQAVGIYDNDELTTSVIMSDALPASTRPDTLNTRRRNFVRSYAHRIVNQRISKKLLDSGAPVLGARIAYDADPIGDQVYARANAKDDDWAAAITLIDAEVRRAVKYGFQQAEYDELIANARRSLTDSVNYAAKRRSSSLAGGIVGSFASGTVRTTPEQSLKLFEAHVASVKLSELEDVFKSMWSEFDPLIWLQGPNVDNVSKAEVLDVYRAAKAADVAPPAIRKQLSFAYQDFGTPGKVVKETRVEDFDIEQIVFDNNVRLNLKKTDFEDKWIRLSVAVGEGWNAFPPDKPALTTLASSFTLGGYEAHKVNELAEIFAGKQVGVNMRIASENLIFSGGTNPDNIEDQLKAWTALLTAPGYRPEWREKFLESIRASFHTIDSTPGGVAGRDLGRIWANGDKRFGFLPQADYEAATLDEVKAVLAPIMKNGAIEIGVVGDFDRQAIIDAVAKTYGALPKRQKVFKEIPEAFELSFPKPAEVNLTHTGAENQGAIYLAWPTIKDWSLTRSRQYGMVRRIFQNRMTQIIREDMGLTYSPGASLNFSKLNADYGYISASMTSDPQYFDAFETAAIDIAADLRSGGITQDEIDRAVKPVLESFERSEKENSSWLGLVARSQTRPERLDWRRSRLATFSAMTPELLDSAARDLFEPKRLHIVKISPEE